MECEAPGYLCTYLQRCGLTYEIIYIDEGLPVPTSLDDISGLIFMGGAGSVNDPKDWIHKELELIRQADIKGVPVLGVCFGAQLISKALGGLVYPADEMEIGWLNVEAVNTPIKHSWLKGLPACFEVFQWHAHIFSLPPDASPLWRSNCNEQQGFIKNNILGMQFHLEVSEKSIKDLTQRYADDLSHVSTCVQNTEQITQRLKARIHEIHQVADQIYNRWLVMAGLIDDSNKKIS